MAPRLLFDWSVTATDTGPLEVFVPEDERFAISEGWLASNPRVEDANGGRGVLGFGEPGAGFTVAAGRGRQFRTSRWVRR